MFPFLMHSADVYKCFPEVISEGTCAKSARVLIQLGSTKVPRSVTYLTNYQKAEKNIILGPLL